MLKLNKIKKVYETGETINAVNGVSLEVNEGEFIAIVGPSGCGKSTLLSIIGLLDTPSSGDYFINNTNASSLSSKDRAKLRNKTFGFVFQSFNLLPRTSVYDNVILPLRYRKSSDRHEQVTKVIEQVGLSNRVKSRPNQLSGGQQQRVAIARALVTQPSVILADEPTGNLDTKTGIEIMELFKTINASGTTILMVTHNEELLAYANRVITMRDGNIESDRKK